VVVEKRGVLGFAADGPPAPPTESYLRHSTRLEDLRDHQARAILALTALPSVAGGRVVLAGHSEGADVAAAVAAKLGAARVSHLVFLGSGGASQMFDVLLLARRHFAEMGAAEREARLAGLRDEMRSMLARPESAEDWQGQPVRRWAGFFPHAPLDDLLALEGVPVFVGHGSDDASVPVEAADLIAVEFLRRGRTDLTYRVYPGADHSFTGSEERLFRDVFAWLEGP
jgi:pimeloyl-ACP methyl ester carboxylesterase